MKRRLQNVLRRYGVEVSRYPHRSSLAARTRDVLDARGVDLVVDVGANRGQYVSFLRDDVGYGGRVVCYEPVGATFAALAATTDARVECRRKALGAVPGRAQIHVSTASDLSSFLAPSELGVATFAEGFRAAGEEEVEVGTLATERLDGSRLFLKLDTQGFDLDVLAGGGDALDKVVAVQLEVSQLPIYERMPSLQDSVAAVRGYGFDVVGFFPVTTADGLRAIEFDLLACRAAS
jgi:FkbM family methyltransferase